MLFALVSHHMRWNTSGVGFVWSSFLGDRFFVVPLHARGTDLQLPEAKL